MLDQLTPLHPWGQEHDFSRDNSREVEFFAPCVEFSAASVASYLRVAPHLLVCPEFRLLVLTTPIALPQVFCLQLLIQYLSNPLGWSPWLPTLAPIPIESMKESEGAGLNSVLVYLDLSILCKIHLADSDLRVVYRFYPVQSMPWRS